MGLVAFTCLFALEPSEAASDEYLIQTGESARRKFFVKVYDIAHFAAPPLQGTIFTHAGTKRVEMVFALQVGPERLRAEIAKAIRDRVDDRVWDRLKAPLAAFSNPIAGRVKAGDRFRLDWKPDGTLVSTFNDLELSRVRDAEFAAAMWSIWLGSRSLVDRDELLREWPQD